MSHQRRLSVLEKWSGAHDSVETDRRRGGCDRVDCGGGAGKWRQSGPHFAIPDGLHRQTAGTDGQRLEATLIEVTYPPGGVNPSHRHPCPVIGYVLEGSLRMELKGQPERIFKPGETFVESPSDVHVVSANASQDVPARFLAYLRVRSRYAVLGHPCQKRPGSRDNGRRATVLGTTLCADRDRCRVSFCRRGTLRPVERPGAMGVVRSVPRAHSRTQCLGSGLLDPGTRVVGDALRSDAGGDADRRHRRPLGGVRQCRAAGLVRLRRCWYTRV